MLSKENFNKINENCLYRLKKEIEKDMHEKYVGDIYWCKNWTFKPRKSRGSDIHMLDSYCNSYDSHCIKLTDKNVDNFEIIFDFTEMKRICYSDSYKYNDDDIIHVGVDSSGRFGNTACFIKSDVEPVKEKLIAKQKEEIKSVKRRLFWEEQKLNDLLND